MIWQSQNDNNTILELAHENFRGFIEQDYKSYYASITTDAGETIESPFNPHPSLFGAKDWVERTIMSIIKSRKFFEKLGNR